MQNSIHSIERRSGAFWAIWAVTAAFGCYFCMYAFRKPFTAASFTSTTVAGIGFKTILVMTQVFGYMLSKVIGVKIIAEMPPARRVLALVLLVGLAEVALILFGIIPRPWNAICMFLNGLTLGLVFGLVMGFLEGRRVSEALSAGLCASFILADGVTKSTGMQLLSWGITEDWMPSLAGAMFAIPFGLFVAMLARIPQPSSSDVAARNQRHVMTRAERISFLKRHGYGLAPLVLIFLCVTLLRSVRADFAPEIWQALGQPAAPSTFSLSETWVALGVMTINGAMVLIIDNRKALLVSLLVCGAGIGLLAITLLMRQAGMLSSFAFMVLLGLGHYLPYVAMHTTVFERILALTRERGNVGFLMYIADSVGYLGYVVVVLARNFCSAQVDFLGWLSTLCWFTIAVSTACLIVSWRHYTQATTFSTEAIPVSPLEPVEA